MPSLRDVAAELDVSISLVSKVLNNRLGNTGVRPELIEKIRTTAQKIGYRKNFSALSLLSRRQNVIAVFVHTHGSKGSGLVEKLLEGISQAASPGAQRIHLEFFLNAEEFLRKSQHLHRGNVDGLIVSGVSHPELAKDLLRIHRTEVPVVTVYNEPIDKRLVNIGIPHAALSDAATTHLIKHGCRNIVHFAIVKERAEGHRRALRRAGIPVRPRLILSSSGPVGFTQDFGSSSVAALLDQGVAFDGISAESDAQASGAINELVRRGLRVPEDVKVVGIDNAPFDELVIVPLTSVSQKFIERGRRAVEAVNAIVDGGDPSSVVLEPEIIVRRSTT